MTQFIFSSNYSVARMNLLPFRFLNQISSQVPFTRVGRVLAIFREVYSLELSHTKKPGGLRDTLKVRKTGLDIFPGVLIQLPQHLLTHSTDVSVTCTNHQACSERPQQWSWLHCLRELVTVVLKADAFGCSLYKYPQVSLHIGCPHSATPSVQSKALASCSLLSRISHLNLSNGLEAQKLFTDPKVLSHEMPLYFCRH